MHYAALAHCSHDVFELLLEKGVPPNKGKTTTALKLYLVMNKPADPRVVMEFLDHGFTKHDLYTFNQLR